jgi:hypothetical protein
MHMVMSSITRLRTKHVICSGKVSVRELVVVRRYPITKHLTVVEQAGGKRKHCLTEMVLSCLAFGKMCRVPRLSWHERATAAHTCFSPLGSGICSFTRIEDHAYTRHKTQHLNLGL